MRTGKLGDLERDRFAAEALLEELAELRELDRRRHTHAPGSPAFLLATQSLESLNQRVMVRVREMSRLDRRNRD